MIYKIDNNTKIVTYNNEEFYPNLINGILIASTEQECIVEKNRREQSKLDTFNVSLNLLREKRNKLLADSDYIVLADSPVNDKANWITYRQQLRDLTEGLSTVEQVNSVVFPTKP